MAGPASGADKQRGPAHLLPRETEVADFLRTVTEELGAENLLRAAGGR